MGDSGGTRREILGDSGRFLDLQFFKDFHVFSDVFEFPKISDNFREPTKNHDKSLVLEILANFQVFSYIFENFRRSRGSLMISEVLGNGGDLRHQLNVWATLDLKFKICYLSEIKFASSLEILDG